MGADASVCGTVTFDGETISELSSLSPWQRVSAGLDKFSNLLRNACVSMWNDERLMKMKKELDDLQEENAI